MPQSTNEDTIARPGELRIVIVRLSAIGDVLMTSPVAQALREAYPHAQISWVVEPLAAPIVQANPYVDEVIIFGRKKQWMKLLRSGKFLTLSRECKEVARELQAHQFDIAIDCHGILKSGLVTKLSGAPRRIGPKPSREGNRFFMTELTTRPQRTTRLSQQYVTMLEALGIPTVPRRPVLQVPEEERMQAREFLASRGIITSPYAACCVATSRPQKDWVWSRWGELADLLWEREGLRTVFIGGPERRCDALRLVEGCVSRPVSAVGNCSLLQSAALVQDAAVVIGGDTGLTYAGLATDTPTVALYGSTDATWLTEEPYTTVIFHPMTCAPCNRRPTCKNYDCMRAISVEEVVSTASALMAQRQVMA